MKKGKYEKRFRELEHNVRIDDEGFYKNFLYRSDLDLTSQSIETNKENRHANTENIYLN